MDYVFGDCLTQGHKDFSYVYSQSSIVFIFIFRYMIHFELICMFDIRNGLKYYFFYKFIEKITFAPFAEKYIDQMGYRFVLGFSVLVHLSIYLFWCQYCCFLISLWSWVAWSFSRLFSLLYVLYSSRWDLESTRQFLPSPTPLQKNKL